MKKQGRGTGSVRRRRFDEITHGWPVCEHKCPTHGVWRHKALPGIACHLAAIMDCAECIEVPTGYGQPLMRTPKGDR